MNAFATKENRPVVLVIGAARSGIASAAFLAKKGNEVYLADLNTALAENVEKALLGLNVHFIWGVQPDINEISPDFIVMSPGIPLSIPPVIEAKKKGIEVISEPELAYRYSEAPFVAITGTNGKTTTTTLTAELLKQEGSEVVAAGNIGTPLISLCPDLKCSDIVVAELSSFQLESVVDFRPKIAVVLNLTPDHLDRHGSMEAYAEAKSHVFSNQQLTDFLILNKDDELVCQMAEKAVSNVLFISQEKILQQGMWLEDDEVFYALDLSMPKQKLIEASKIGIVGKHNLQNAMAASLAALLMGISPEVIRQRLMAFKGVEHRMEFVAELEGVRYINDSKGTNPDSTEKALVSYEGHPIVLIAGGKNKGSDFRPLVPLIKQYCRSVVLVGEATNDFIKAFEDTAYASFQCANSFEEAVSLAHDAAQTGDVVLLSPACASWDMFKSYEERGDLFKKLVKTYESRKK